MPDDLTPFQPGYVHQDDEEGRHTFDLSCLFPNPTDSDRGVLAPTGSPGSRRYGGRKGRVGPPVRRAAPPALTRTFRPVRALKRPALIGNYA